MKKLISKYRDSPAVKLGIFFVSLLLSLTLLELGLRAAGYAVTAGRTAAFTPPYDDAIADSDSAFERYRDGRGRGRLILTFGDSLTNAGNVKSYHSYPYYLYRRFADSGARAAVYNIAKCEESTFGVAAKLKRYLAENPEGRGPDTIVVLVGAADLFNLPLVEKKMTADDTSWADVLPAGWVYTLRLYKVWRHIKLSWLARYGADADGEEEGLSMEKRLATLLGVYAAHTRDMGGDQAKPLAPALVDEIHQAFSREETSHDDLDMRSAADFASFLADYASVVYTPRARYDKFFALLLDMAEKFPAAFWTPEFDTASYFFVQTYQLQSKYTAEDVLRVLDAGAAKHPGLLGNGMFVNFRKYLSDRDAMDRYVDRRRMEAWDEIVRLSRERGIRVVLQNYPVEYKSANRVLAEVARKHGLMLVDNRKHFAGLLEKGGREAYLEDNDHLTPAGYEIMAENVYRALTADGPAAGRD